MLKKIYYLKILTVLLIISCNSIGKKSILESICPCCKEIDETTQLLLTKQNKRKHSDTTRTMLRIYFKVDTSTMAIMYISDAKNPTDSIFVNDLMTNNTLVGCIRKKYTAFPRYYFYNLKKDYYYYIHAYR